MLLIFQFPYERFSYPGVACSKKVGNHPAQKIIITTQERSETEMKIKPITSTQVLKTSTPESGSGTPSEYPEITNSTTVIQKN